MASNLPDRADVVVVGAGIIGLSTAYHLCCRGCTDVVVLERNEVASGTTWHSAGGVGSVRPNESAHRLISRIYDFIDTIEEESGMQIGHRQVGAIWVASEAERWAEIRRLYDQASAWGPEVQLLTPDDIKELNPLLEAKDLIGGMYTPKEGWTSPIDFARAVARAATNRGASIIENAPVDAIHVESGRVTSVEVAGHRIYTNTVANCAGIWGRHIGQLAGVDVPLQAVEHYYAITVKSDQIPRNIPALRDQNIGIYVKEDAGALLVGSFERMSQPVDIETLPADFAFGELPGHFEDQFYPIFEASCERIPILRELEIRQFFCGPESFTPDGEGQLGPVEGLNGFYVCCGCNSRGVQSSAGWGGSLADWIVDGHAPSDLSAFDVRRNEPFANTRSYVWDRSIETMGRLYDHHFPYKQIEAARGVRRSPLHALLAERGACFGEVAGYERANWFAPEGVKPEYQYSYLRPHWLGYAAVEHQAMREGVGLIDLSSFATFQVFGPQSLPLLQETCSANVDVELGRTVYTHWLNDRAGIEADLTVTRLDESIFQVTTGVGVRRRNWDWLQHKQRDYPDAQLVDTSSGSSVIGVFGPKSHELLTSVASVDLSNSACPPMHSLTLEVGSAVARAVRVCFAGGPGWELHMGAEFAPHVFEVLETAGKPLGIRLCGMHALDSCRIECGYVHFGHEVSQDETPFHVGLGFTCNFNKGSFTGRDAARAVKEAGLDSLDRRMASLVLQSPEPMLYGNEPILRDGQPTGYISSAAYGHSLGTSIGLGWLRNADGVSTEWVNAGQYEVLVEGESVPATAQLAPLLSLSR